MKQKRFSNPAYKRSILTVLNRHSREDQETSDSDQNTDAKYYPSAPVIPWLAVAVVVVTPGIAAAVGY